jgi:hypothetical protein
MKYTVTLSQTYTQELFVSFQVESNLSSEEFQNKMSELTKEWRIERLSEDELSESEDDITGYVKGSYSSWDGDLIPSSEVWISSVEESKD